MKLWIPLAISQKIHYSEAKPKNIVVFAFPYVFESFTLFSGDFFMDLYSVDSDEAIKH